jgi:MFS family permease
MCFRQRQAAPRTVAAAAQAWHSTGLAKNRANARQFKGEPRVRAELKPGADGAGGQAPSAQLDLGAGIWLVAVLSVAQLVSQFLRSAVSVIAPNLVVELEISAAGLALLSSSFFLALAIAQIPIGMLIDRFGPRLTMLLSTAIAVAGCVVFAVGPDLNTLVLGRVLMALGCSSFYVAPLAIYARWFKPKYFSTVVGTQLGLSGLGLLAATAPLAYAAATIGWRSSFIIVAVLAGLSGLIVLWWVSDDPPGAKPHDHKKENFVESLRGLLAVTRTPAFWPIFAMHLTNYAVIITILGLWAGPYLAHVYGHDLETRGFYLLVLAVASTVSVFLWGPADRLFGSYRTPVLLGSGLTLAMLIFISLVGKMDAGLLLAWFALYGLVTGYPPVLTAQGRALFPPQLVGRGLTLFNLATMGGAFVFQFATGAVIEFMAPNQTVYPLAAYQAAFGMQAVLLAISIGCYLLARPSVRRA